MKVCFFLPARHSITNLCLWRKMMGHSNGIRYSPHFSFRIIGWIVWVNRNAHIGGNSFRLPPIKRLACASAAIFHLIDNNAFGTNSEDNFSFHGLFLTCHAVEQNAVFGQLQTHLHDGCQSLLLRNLDDGTSASKMKGFLIKCLTLRNSSSDSSVSIWALFAWSLRSSPRI